MRLLPHFYSVFQERPSRWLMRLRLLPTCTKCAMRSKSTMSNTVSIRQSFPTSSRITSPFPRTEASKICVMRKQQEVPLTASRLPLTNLPMEGFVAEAVLFVADGPDLYYL